MGTEPRTTPKPLMGQNQSIEPKERTNNSWLSLPSPDLQDSAAPGYRHPQEKSALITPAPKDLAIPCSEPILSSAILVTHYPVVVPVFAGGFLPRYPARSPSGACFMLLFLSPPLPAPTPGSGRHRVRHTGGSQQTLRKGKLAPNRTASDT